MPEPARLTLLKALDSKVWIPKRLFPARLILLDKAVRGSMAKNIVMFILDSLPRHVNVLKSLPSPREKEFLTAVAWQSATELDIRTVATKFGRCPFSPVEQFLSDLNVYGLREAIAYLSERSVPALPADRIDKLLDAYGKIGKAFLAHQTDIRSRMNHVFSDFRRSRKPPADKLGRLILKDAIFFGDPWSDGEAQHNYSGCVG